MGIFELTPDDEIIVARRYSELTSDTLINLLVLFPGYSLSGSVDGCSGYALVADIDHANKRISLTFHP
jgi:hypothetical protein